MNPIFCTYRRRHSLSRFSSPPWPPHPTTCCVWTQTEQLRDLVGAALATFLATIARYDGWALFLALVVAIVLIDWLKHQPQAKTVADVLIFGVLGGIGIIMWFVRNLVIFGSPSAFLSGSYSSQSQTKTFIQRGVADDYHNLWLSLRVLPVCYRRVHWTGDSGSHRCGHRRIPPRRRLSLERSSPPLPFSSLSPFMSSRSFSARMSCMFPTPTFRLLSPTSTRASAQRWRLRRRCSSLPWRGSLKRSGPEPRAGPDMCGCGPVRLALLGGITSLILHHAVVAGR